MTSRFVSLAIAAVSCCLVACSESRTLPLSSVVAPSPVSSASGTSQPMASNAGRTHGRALTAVSGTGFGIVNVTPTASADGFSAEITVTVHAAAPDLDFYVQRAPEIGRADGADGVCQRAMGVAPWGPPAPNFVTFPLPLAAPLLVLHTSAGGAGTVHFSFDLPSIADGTAFDVMFRVGSPGTELEFAL